MEHRNVIRTGTLSKAIGAQGGFVAGPKLVIDYLINRCRTLIYSTLLAVLFGVFLFALFNRDPLTLDVIRDRNAIYRELADGRVENVYTLKLLNKADLPHEIALSVDGLPGVSLETDPAEIRVAAGSMSSIIARVRVPRDAAHPGGHNVVFRAERGGEQPAEVERESRFMLPLN